MWHNMAQHAFHMEQSCYVKREEKNITNCATVVLTGRLFLSIFPCSLCKGLTGRTVINENPRKNKQ